MEAKVHGVEALLGILVSLSEGRTQHLITELCEDDPYIRRVLADVYKSPFGPAGRHVTSQLWEVRDDKSGTLMTVREDISGKGQCQILKLTHKNMCGDPLESLLNWQRGIIERMQK